MGEARQRLEEAAGALLDAVEARCLQVGGPGPLRPQGMGWVAALRSSFTPLERSTVGSLSPQPKLCTCTERAAGQRVSVCRNALQNILFDGLTREGEVVRTLAPSRSPMARVGAWTSYLSSRP